MPTFQGQEYLINSPSTGNEVFPTQTVLGNGDILVAWETGETPDAPTEVHARILNPDGNVSAPDFIVNTTPGLSGEVATTALSNGNALLTWSSGTDTLARVVDAQGHLGPEVVVNSGDSETGVSAATLTDGNVMLVSTAVTNTVGGREIAGHLLGADGTPTGSFAINYPGHQIDPAITAMSDGNAFVTWIDGDSHVMYGQVLNPNGSAHAPYFQINPNSAGQFELQPTALANGNVLVTWDANDGIHGQIVNPDGGTAGSDFLISVAGSQSAGESVTALADGRAVVTWERFDGSDGGDIYARVINADGSMTSPEFVVNSATDRAEINPHVTELPNGEIFVSWTSSAPNSDEDIHGRLLTLDHTITGTPGNDVLQGTAGNDEIYGGDGNDNLIGGAGDDILSGGTGHNLLWGNDGNDTFIAGPGADTFAGGNGSDTVLYEHSNAGVTVNLAAGTATSSGDGNGDIFTSIENITGSAHNDMLIGDAAANHLDGNAGDDRIWGGDGNDTLTGGHGADVLAGGAGIDTIDYSTSSSAVAVNLATGTASGGDATGDSFTSIENITGSTHNDALTGDAGANHLDGGAGNDLIWGGDGNDTLTGGSGADTLSGGAGIDTADYSTSQGKVTVDLALGTGSGGDAQGDRLTSIENITGSAFDDHLIGNTAANQIFGGAGADVLTGGAGADTFVFKTVQDSTPAHQDQITDFSSAQGDHIDLSAIDANTQAAGHQDFGFIGSAAFSDVAGQLRFADHFLEGDVNGDGAADFRVNVNVASLQHGDLIL
ncbi:Ca2+-binding RTX toxin-like protein [Nitrobacteraceae bacterium AZCC 1564]